MLDSAGANPPPGKTQNRPVKTGTEFALGLAIAVVAAGILVVAWMGSELWVYRVFLGTVALLLLVLTGLLFYREFFLLPQTAKRSVEWDAVFALAMTIVLLSFGLLAWFAVNGNTTGMTASGAIVGTWVGAVVTFYFTRGQATLAREAGAKAGSEAFADSQHAVSLLQEEVRGQSDIAQRLGEELKRLKSERKRDEGQNR